MKLKKHLIRCVTYLVSAFFFISCITFPNLSYSQSIPWMPKPGIIIHLSPPFTPAHLEGMTIHPDNALQFDFLIHRGDSVLTENQRKEEYQRLVKYFLASLTIPDEDQWVNLSPYEKDRIIRSNFGKTEMGRDLLAQDYLLKQITSSLIYPEERLGKRFWDKIYERAWKEYGTTNIPVNTFNKVWIVPDEAVVYESKNTAYVLRNHLKVMMEEDYLSLQKHKGIANISNRSADTNQYHALASKIVKDIIIPELEIEVNENKNFAPLRQIYSGMILATWYKKALKESLLGKVYANRAKVKGVDQDDPKANEAIYQQYLKAFKKGVFNYIKEDEDKYSKEVIPRKYFSGGAKGFNGAVDASKAMMAVTGHGSGAAVLVVKDLEDLPAGLRGRITDSSVDQENIDNATISLNPPKSKAGRLLALVGAIAMPLITWVQPAQAGPKDFDDAYVLNQDLHGTTLSPKDAKSQIQESYKRMFETMIEKHESLFPEQAKAPLLEKIVKGATTWDEVAAKTRAYFKEKETRYKSGVITPQEMIEYEQVQREAVNWYKGIFRVFKAYDEFGAKTDRWNPNDWKLSIEGNYHYQVINKKGERIRTFTCETACNETIFALNDLGITYVFAVQVDENFKNEDQNKDIVNGKGGHVTLVVGFGMEHAHKIFLDLAQYELGVYKEILVDNNVTHHKIEAIEDGKLKVRTISNQDDLDKLKIENGENKDDLLNRLKLQAKINRLFVRVNQAHKDPKDLEAILAEIHALSLEPYLKRAEIYRSDILQNDGTLQNILTRLPVGQALKIRFTEVNAILPKLNDVITSFKNGNTVGLKEKIEEALVLIEAQKKSFENSNDSKVIGDQSPLRDSKGTIIDSAYIRQKIENMETKLRYIKGELERTSTPSTKPVTTQPGKASKAMIGDKELKDFTKGGIDLNSANLNLQIKRDGKGVPLPLASQDMAQLMTIEGFIPTIIEIKPAVGLPIFSELNEKLQTRTMIASAA